MTATGFALPFLVLVLAVIPVVAVLNSRASQAATLDTLSRPALYVQLLLVQLVVGALAVLAVWGTGLAVSWGARVAPDTLLLAVGVLLVAVGASLAVRGPRGSSPDLAAFMAPRGAGERALWLAAMAAVAIVEEFAYRGVLFALAAGLLPTWAAAILCALAFGLAHAAQGWRGVVASTVVALALQVLVLHSGGLALAIAAHFAYDAGAQWYADWRAR